MKSIIVTCAIICRNKKILACQRPLSKTLALKWEFPGGKLEPNETLEACIARELMEELGIKVSILDRLPIFSHPLDRGLTLELNPFICNSFDQPILLEHNDMKWLSLSEISELDWADADKDIVTHLIQNPELIDT